VTRLTAGLLLSLVVFGFSRTAMSPLVASGFSRKSASLERFEFEQPHMGTTARVVLYAPDALQARTLAGRAFARIGELDARLSDYRADSELLALCRAAGGPPVTVSDDLYTVLAAAQRISQQTEGAFDVSVGPVSRLWRRARVTGEPPSAAAIDDARALVRYQHIELLPDRRVRLAKAGMLLDLGGVAKGYAADQALSALRAAGVPRALVAMGGDIAAGDAPPGKDGWTIAVTPLGPRVRTAVPPLTLRDAALSTSGDAEQYFEHKGTRYSHILTPPTGQALQGRRGVTVIAREGITADALATAVAVLGNERGLALVESTPHAAAIVLDVTAQGIREHRSSRW
jgi:thiamine biosynthesis lipoprotein